MGSIRSANGTTGSMLVAPLVEPTIPHPTRYRRVHHVIDLWLTFRFQITQRMLHGVVRAGQQGFIEGEWRRDTFPELHNDDALWAYMVRASEEYRLLDRGRLRDDVLRRLLRMGIYDWTGEDNRLNQTTPAMRHATAMVTRLVNRLLEVEEKVVH
jgi:hypothetical protein